MSPLFTKPIISKSQTLITGVYRTGSEYITLLLNNHPDLSASMYRINPLRFTCPAQINLCNETELKTLITDFNIRLEDRYGIKLPIDLINEWIVERGINFTNFYDVIMSHLYLRDGASHWAEKCQLLWREIDLFLANFPNGRAIHIIRDPRSVLSSFKRFTNAPHPKYLEAIFNCYDSMKTANIQTRNPKIFVVKYEDILANPQNEIEKIWEFLGLSVNHRVSLDSAYDAFKKGGFRIQVLKKMTLTWTLIKIVL